MAECLSDADCGAPASWCAEARLCDTLHGNVCADWPRCRITPWLICLPDAELCVDVAPQGTSTQPTGAPSEAVLAVSVLVSLLVLLVLFVSIGLAYHLQRRRRHAEDPRAAATRPTFALPLGLRAAESRPETEEWS